MLSTELTRSGHPTTALHSSGSADNLKMMRSGRADIALVQNNIAGEAQIGEPNSGSRHITIALLATVGIDLGNLQAIQETGLQRGLELLASGQLDAVIATIGAPAKALQRAAAGGKIRLLTLTEDQRTTLAKERNEFIPVVLPLSTYPGQHEAVPTMAVTARW